MSKITLTYFDFAASRGEECRLALHLAGLEFTDDRVKLVDFPARKHEAPFGALPFITFEGHPPIAQSNTILRLIGRRHGLLPKDDLEAARHESIMEAVEDLRNRMAPALRMKDDAEKKKARQELGAGYMQEWGAAVDKQVRGPFVGGADISVADLKIFVALGAILKGTVDYLPPSVFEAYPRLMGVHAAVKAHPRVVDWYARA